MYNSTHPTHAHYIIIYVKEWLHFCFCTIQKTSFLNVNPKSVHFSFRVLPSIGFPQKKTVTFPFFCSLILVNTLFQFGRPALVRDLRPVTRSRCSFLKLRSMASCRNTDFMSVFCSAEVMYICISSMRPSAPPVSDISSSSWDRRLTNHSKLFWSRLIQKKSTFRSEFITPEISSAHWWSHLGHTFFTCRYL